jgi:hypothetical protein
MAERDRVVRVRQGPPRPPAGATEPAVRVLGPIGDEAAADAPEPEVPLIDDESVAARPASPWHGDAPPERKPLLTRAEPLDRSRGTATRWALRLAALAVIVALLIVLIVLVAGGGI